MILGTNYKEYFAKDKKNPNRGWEWNPGIRNSRGQLPPLLVERMKEEVAAGPAHRDWVLLVGAGTRKERKKRNKQTKMILAPSFILSSNFFSMPSTGCPYQKSEGKGSWERSVWK